MLLQGIGRKMLFSRTVIRHFMMAIVSVAAFGGGAVQAAPPSQAQGSWEKVACPFDASKAQLPVTCGRLKVPENYDDPKSRSIEIAFMVIKAAQNIDPENPVIFLNGGPGGTSLVYAERLVATPYIRDIVVDRDWVFFDQRGAGRSNPALYCPEEDDWWKRLNTCRDQLMKLGVDLSQYNSARIASDMEALRKALGVKQWNLWGASYGTRLALTMARYYPSSVRSLLLDAPYLPEDQETVGDFHGTEVVLHRIFSKCAADTGCASRFPQLRSRFMAALPRLRKQPLSIGETRLDDNKAMHFIKNSLYSGGYLTLERRVQTILAYMDATARGDGALMLRIEQRMKEEGERAANAARSRSPVRAPVPNEVKHQMGQGLSIGCNEERSFESVEEYAQAMAKSEIIYSLFGETWPLDSNFKTCALWPAGRADPIENTHVYYDGPMLVFTGELDASLAGVDGYKIEMLYANATNVVFRNSAHIQVSMAGSGDPSRDWNYYRLCGAGLARQFLADPRRALDARCSETRKFRLVQ